MEWLNESHGVQLKAIQVVGNLDPTQFAHCLAPANAAFLLEGLELGRGMWAEHVDGCSRVGRDQLFNRSKCVVCRSVNSL